MIRPCPSTNFYKHQHIFMHILCTWARSEASISWRTAISLPHSQTLSNSLKLYLCVNVFLLFKCSTHTILPPVCSIYFSIHLPLSGICITFPHALYHSKSGKFTMCMQCTHAPSTINSDPPTLRQLLSNRQFYQSMHKIYVTVKRLILA